MKTVSIIGTRPQLIKYAPLSNELRKKHRDILVHTGQHYDYNMDRVFFDELGIPEPDYNLGIGSGTHAYQVAEMLKGVAEVLDTEKPDLVMLYGDTNSTIAGALAAIQLQLKAAHVEAGLRGFLKYNIEETNRLLTDHCSKYLFCPTQTAVDNLKQEGISEGVYLTGDVMVDALKYSWEIAERSNILSEIGLTSKQYFLVTVHRSFNTDNQQNLENIVSALTVLSEMGETVVFPIHPRTVKLLKEYSLYDDLRKRANLIEPQGYFEFLKLMIHAKKILTDSGGIQKEAYILKIPCITFRPNTEWVETVNDGWNVLVGTDGEKIIEMARNFMPTHPHSNLFGLGACIKIADILEAI
jgi:UDP-N-acetylglucosamine 2-epimerase